MNPRSPMPHHHTLQIVLFALFFSISYLIIKFLARSGSPLHPSLPLLSPSLCISPCDFLHIFLLQFYHSKLINWNFSITVGFS
ncbi:hypothetical protein MtrunA17_Chr3g0114031 [Medicago truncatula]|uniref:Transmembrane protein n=1 Tax=Medicago truncatula TaxID=3880 RepID=A0A396IZQ2_MEDTR|nr:hypothetical protein MtrunA17_Chr3g0114031 [Medicago truncatula]